MCTRMVNFNLFPKEVILTVFSYLRFKELLCIIPVCKLWKILAEDPSIYRKIVLTGKDLVETWKILKIIHDKKFLRELILYERRDCVQILKCAAISCPTLETVSITKARITSDALRSLSDNCRSIIQLHLDGCDLIECNLTDLSTLTNIRSMSINNCYVRHFNQVVDLLKEIPLLEELNIEFLKSVDPDARLSTFLPHENVALQTLFFDGFNLQAGELQQICSTKKRMIILGVVGIGESTEDDVLSIFLMRRLVWLRVAGADIVSSQWSNVFRRHQLTNLRHLDLSYNTGIKDENLKAIGESFPHLSYLCISSCDLVTDDGVASLIDNCSCPLKFLIAEDLHQLKGRCLLGIPSNLPHLVLLALSGSFKLDAASVAILQERMPRLALNWTSMDGCDKTNARYDQLRYAKEMEEYMTAKEAREMYDINEES